MFDENFMTELTKLYDSHQWDEIMKLGNEVSSNEWTLPFIKIYTKVLMYHCEYQKTLSVAAQKYDDFNYYSYYILLGYLYWRCGWFEKTISTFKQAMDMPVDDSDFRISEMEEEPTFYIEIAEYQLEREKKLRAMDRFKVQPNNWNFEPENFWYESGNKNLEEAYPTDEVIEAANKYLGYKLPESYIALMRVQNGGMPKCNTHKSLLGTSWGEDCIAIESFSGIGFEKVESLCGKYGNKEALGDFYPDIGIVICDCPSGGHDQVYLDYRKNGEPGEPEVVHVDQYQGEFIITLLANNFQEFAAGLYDPYINED